MATHLLLLLLLLLSKITCKTLGEVKNVVMWNATVHETIHTYLHDTPLLNSITPSKERENFRKAVLKTYAIT